MGSSENHQNLIFLVSQPRAGSTLLQRIFQGHSEIHSVPEPWLMLYPLYNLRTKGINSDYNVAWANAAARDFYRSLDGGEENYFIGVRKMYGELYDKALRNSGKTYFLDKTPRYYHIIPELKRTFPNAKYIILVRNPLAVMASILNTWIKGDWLKLDRFRHDLLTAPNLLVKGKTELRQSSFAFVSYEELLDKPEQILRQVCHQISIEFTPDMLNCKPTRQSGFGFKDQSERSLQSGLITKNPSNWLSTFKDPQAWRLANEYVTALGESTFENMGYSSEEIKKTLSEMKPNSLALLGTYSLDYLIGDATSNQNRKSFYLNQTLRFLKEFIAMRRIQELTT